MLLTKAPLLALWITVAWCPFPAAAQIPADPIYINIGEGWQGMFAHGSAYAKYSLVGPTVRLQDAYHASLRPGLGVMVAFADKKEFGNGTDLLADHARWETEYWRSRADRLESSARDDLAGPRKDVRVTELKLFRNNGDRMTIYMIALASKDGVFVLSVSPAGQGTDQVVAALVRSFTLVPRTLDPGEVARVTRELKSGSAPKR